MAKPWPNDCVQIVCSLPQHFNYALVQGERCEGSCADCGCAISFDSYSVEAARKLYPQLGPKTICTQCLLTYEPHKMIHASQI